MSIESTVFIIDADLDERESLQRLLRDAGFVVSTYDSVEKFLDAYDPDDPGCIVSDIRPSSMSGLDLLRVASARRWPTPIIVMTDHDDFQSAVHALESGAVGYVMKPVDSGEMLARIRGALDLDAHTRRDRARRTEVEDLIGRLTEREREVLTLIVGGKTSKQVARRLGISDRTVEVHRSRIMKKLRTDSLAEMVGLALEGGIGSVEDRRHAPGVIFRMGHV